MTGAVAALMSMALGAAEIETGGAVIAGGTEPGRTSSFASVAHAVAAGSADPLPLPDASFAFFAAPPPESTVLVVRFFPASFFLPVFAAG